MTQPAPGIAVLVYRLGQATEEVFPGATAWAIDGSGALTVQQATSGQNVTSLVVYPKPQWLRVRAVQFPSANDNSPSGVGVMVQSGLQSLIEEYFTDGNAWVLDSLQNLTIQKSTTGTNVIAVAAYPGATWFRVRIVSATITSTTGARP